MMSYTVINIISLYKKLESVMFRGNWGVPVKKP